MISLIRKGVFRTLLPCLPILSLQQLVTDDHEGQCDSGSEEEDEPGRQAVTVSQLEGQVLQGREREWKDIIVGLSKCSYVIEGVAWVLGWSSWVHDKASIANGKGLELCYVGNTEQVM